MGSLLLFAGALLFPQEPPTSPELPRLSDPIRIEADGKPIAAVRGHAAPFVVDYDGDGVRDLVVGMYGTDMKDARGGTARIYRNSGSNEAPRFEAHETLLAEGKPATMESG